MEISWMQGKLVEEVPGALRMEIPAEPFVVLLGNWQGPGQGTPWRADAARRLSREGLAWFDTSQQGWRHITPENGDRFQDVIDRLVDHEQRAIEACACAVMYLVTPRHADGTPGETPLASRVELGELCQRSVPSFVVIGDDVKGRNYLRAVVTRQPHLLLCRTLDEAIERAANHLRTLAQTSVRESSQNIF